MKVWSFEQCPLPSPLLRFTNSMQPFFGRLNDHSRFSEGSNFWKHAVCCSLLGDYFKIQTRRFRHVCLCCFEGWSLNNDIRNAIFVFQKMFYLIWSDQNKFWHYQFILTEWSTLRPLLYLPFFHITIFYKICNIQT